MSELNITTASVKVMRSYDYCHFEVCLGTDLARSTEEVDALRKEAARLADKAVEQYKIAKENLRLRESDQYNAARLHADAKLAMETPENEQSPEQKAVIKRFMDKCYQNRRAYDYEDDWSEPDWDDDDAGY